MGMFSNNLLLCNGINIVLPLYLSYLIVIAKYGGKCFTNALIYQVYTKLFSLPV